MGANTRLPSLLEVLKPAIGPSSSHTLGPMRAGRLLRHRLADRGRSAPGESLQVILYGSLAHTGKGHLSDRAVVAGLYGMGPEDVAARPLEDVYEASNASGVLLLDLADGTGKGIAFRPETDVLFDRETPPALHPNTLRFVLHDHTGRIVLDAVYYSIGGGVVVEGAELTAGAAKTQANPTFARTIIQRAETSGCSLAELALEMEEAVYGHSRAEVEAHLESLWLLMSGAVDRGLEASGALPGVLKTERRAGDMLRRLETDRGRSRIVTSESTKASIYAIAVAEENAAGGAVVTAPTCGSAGVLPACLRVMKEAHGLPNESIHEALLVAGVIGGLAIAKASVAGALVGCQGEVGVASAMAAAAVCHLLGGSVLDQVDRAAETALEHFLGLTCDPVAGLVQIPCIERNAAGAVSALNAASLAMISGGRDRVSFDATLEVMHQTGLDMRSRYKETSLGGLAAVRDLDRDGVDDLPGFCS